MAKSLSVAFQNALTGNARYQVALYTFELGSGTYGFWTHEGEKPYNGVTYRAGGSLIEVGEIREALDGSVGQLELKMSALPEKGLTDDVLVRFYEEDWHLKPVTVQLGLMDPATAEIIEVQTFFRGRIEEAPFDEVPGAVLSLKCASTSIDLSIPGGLIRNGGTQKLFDPTDTSMDEIGNLNGQIHKDVNWGQA